MYIYMYTHAVTKQITVADKYQKQLAELDLMAEDWVDTD